MSDEQEHSAAVAEATKGMAPKILKVSEELSCELNDVEWSNRARDFADAQERLESERQRKKDITKQLNADLSSAEARVSKLASVVSTRREQRDVTVEVKHDYELGKVTKTRTDTKEVISEREMTDNERQGELELTDANKFIESRHDDSKAGSPFDDDDSTPEPSEPEDEADATADTDEDEEEASTPVESEDIGEPDAETESEDDDDWGDIEEGDQANA